METTKQSNSILISIFLFFLFYSCSGDYKERLKNCEDVKKGMSESKVIEIMGKPAERSEDKLIGEEGYYVLYYGMPAMASTGIDIYFDSKTQKVTDVICGE